VSMNGRGHVLNKVFVGLPSPELRKQYLDKKKEFNLQLNRVAAHYNDVRSSD